MDGCCVCVALVGALSDAVSRLFDNVVSTSVCVVVVDLLGCVASLSVCAAANSCRPFCKGRVGSARGVVCSWAYHVYARHERLSSYVCEQCRIF